MIGLTIRLPEITRLGANAGEQVSPYSSDAIPITMTWTLSDADKTISIPLNAGNGAQFNFEIDWGDGTIETITSTTCTHTYTTGGDKETKITGICEGLSFNNIGDKLKITGIYGGNGHIWKYLTSAFYGCTNMTEAIVGKFDTSLVTSFNNTWRNCSSLTTLDVSGFDTSSITSFLFTWYNCSSLTTLDVSGFDTSSITSFLYTWYNCSSLTTLDVSGFDTSSVTSFSNTWRNCSSLTTLDVSGFDTSSITSFSDTWYNCSSLTTLDVSGFDTSSVTNFSYTWYNCSSLTTLDVSGFECPLVISALNMINVNGIVSTADYDAFLILNDSLPSVSTCSWTIGNAKYTAGGAAEAARTSLIGKGWTITDGGPA